MARPSDYTQEIGEEICRRLAGSSGNPESLRKICADEAMPDKSTVLRWLLKDEHKEFRDQYARAREVQAEVLVDEIIEIADESEGDLIGKQIGEDGPVVEVVNHENIARSRLRVDARKWFASKVAPKRYGDRVTNEHTGPNGGPIRTAVGMYDLSDEELAVIAVAGRNRVAAAPASADQPSGVRKLN